MTVAVLPLQCILSEVTGGVCVCTNEETEALLLGRLENPISSTVILYHSSANHFDSCEWH